MECSDCEIGNVDVDMTNGDCNAGFDWGFVDWLVLVDAVRSWMN